MVKVDKKYCMSSFLMFRSLLDSNKTFKKGIQPSIADLNFERKAIRTSADLNNFLKEQIKKATKDNKAALMLSGGMDSAILARYMPKGSVAYTFKPVVKGVEVKDEISAAAKYAEYCGLVHKTIEIDWEDYAKLSPKLMEHKGAPIHSIEPQIYKAALQAKKDGFEKLIFGENADIIYGGFDRLLSKDWTYGEFIDRYSHILPYKILKEGELITKPFKDYEENGYINIYEFMNDIFRKESLGSYINACSLAGIELVTPFAMTYMAEELDYERVRNGENKYIIREVFSELYEDFEIPEKLPMLRPVDEWFKDWEGPQREEFWPNSIINMTGDQKWLVYILEKYLDMID